jgi:hypothetical protein
MAKPQCPTYRDLEVERTGTNQELLAVLSLKREALSEDSAYYESDIERCERTRNNLLAEIEAHVKECDECRRDD